MIMRANVLFRCVGGPLNGRWLWLPPWLAGRAAMVLYADDGMRRVTYREAISRRATGERTLVVSGTTPHPDQGVGTLVFSSTSMDELLELIPDDVRTNDESPPPLLARPANVQTVMALQRRLESSREELARLRHGSGTTTRNRLALIVLLASLLSCAVELVRWAV